MKKLTVLSLVFAMLMLFGSCSVFQKNGKTSDKPAKEQPENTDDYSTDEADDSNNDW